MKTQFQHCVVFFFLLLSVCLYSQTTGFSGTGGNIDVKHYSCNWTIDPGSSSKTISGSVTICFVTKASNVTTITFDFNKNSYNNGSLSVFYHGSSLSKSFPASGTPNILTINLPAPLPINKFDSLTINYTGLPPAATTQAIGYQKSGNLVYTLSESYEDRDWWPCKADMQDKADSLDITITCPSAYLPAANGELVSNTVSGANRTVYYRHRYPIASYLVAIAVGPFTNYDRGTVAINGTNMPVNYFILAGSHTTAQINTNLTKMDFCKQELVAFSSKFGDYPFKNEKYGMYEFAWGGGMEHQSFSGMNWGSMGSWSTIAHELAHQWFGDKVTFSTWNHLWLAEGFARYCEALAAETVPALGQNASTVRSGFKTAANGTTLRNYGCFIPNSSITNSDVLWSSNYGSSVYERGAMVVSMLRKLAGDTKFFLALRNYLSDPALAYKSATSDDLKNHFEAVLGYDLDPFFADFVNGAGYPSYTIKWGNNNKRINIELTSQTPNGTGAASYFHTPVVLKIANAGGTVDTTVVIYDQNGLVSYAGNGIQGTRSGKTLAYDLSFIPATVTFDPDNETLATGTITPDHTKLDNLTLSTLDVKIIDFKSIQKEDGNWLSLSIAPTDDKASITLERSEDGIHFYTLGDMIMRNSTSTSIEYFFFDKNVFDRQAYNYRAKTVDDKGVINYSKIIRMVRQNEVEIRIAPNPAKEYIKISLPQSWQGRALSYVIYHNSGSILRKERTEAGNDITVKLSNMPSGSYHIELTDADGKRTSKAFTIIY
jgi:aminopeptidase N